MSEFLSSMVKSSGNKYASLVSDGLDGSDVAACGINVMFKKYTIHNLT